MRRALIILFLFFLFAGFITKGVSFAQISPGQILRSEEMREREETLRKRIEGPEKVYIKKIMVKGATLLSEEEINEIVSPFQRHWLAEEEIQQILEAIKQAYQEKGYPEQPAKISYRIQRKNLIIEVEE